MSTQMYPPNAPSIQASSQSQSRPAFNRNAQMPTTQIEMTLSCRNLLDMDTFSLSDPYCSVQMKHARNDPYSELGRTETIWDCLNPEWVKKFYIDYNFEMVQYMRFEVWDVDSDGQNDFLGFHETTLGEIVAYASRQYVRPLGGVFAGGKPRNCGEIIIVTEEVATCKQSVQLSFRAENLPRSLFGLFRPDPFLVISRSNEDGTFSVVHKTPPVSSSKFPHWRPIMSKVSTMCNGDFERAIKIDCFDAWTNGKHRLIGSCYTSLRELISYESNPNKAFPLRKIRHKHKKPTKNVQFNQNYRNGLLILREVSLIEELSFLDYIKSGTQMHFAVAIDFTGSNGDPRHPTSLHYLDHYGHKPNSYEIALRSVGEIIQQYDTAGMFPAFGFGARLPPDGKVSHQFPLNGNADHPYCSTIEEIVQNYRRCLETVALYGPTNFASIIQNTAAIAESHQTDGKHYFVLLIITDGIISDMHATKRAIVHAAKLPLSIIIVGVGNADFAAMDELDSDDRPLEVDGLYAARDIVQFVPLNRFITSGQGNVGRYVYSQAELAREVLAEIPDQMTGYMKSIQHFKPHR